MISCFDYSQRHTHVFDDDSDYFCSSNPWLTLQEREDMKKREAEFFSKKQESRRNKKVTLNLKGENKEMNIILSYESAVTFMGICHHSFSDVFM